MSTIKSITFAAPRPTVEVKSVSFKAPAAPYSEITNADEFLAAIVEEMTPAEDTDAL